MRLLLSATIDAKGVDLTSVEEFAAGISLGNNLGEGVKQWWPCTSASQRVIAEAWLMHRA
jgi:hypothetical protein